jgi:hypothetical protein
MAEQLFQPIKTPIGILKGRDAIFLDRLNIDIQQGILTLEGGFNGELASEPISEEVGYSLVFYGVLALKVIELDSWDYKCASSFDEVVNSEWCAKLGGKVDESFKHYMVQTYDDVIDVVCRKFTLTIKASEPSLQPIVE